MPYKLQKRETRSTTQKFYGGTPSDIELSDLPTYRQIVRYSYFLEATCHRKTVLELSKIVLDKILTIWKKANSSLPLMRYQYLLVKVQRVLSAVKKVNHRKSGRKAFFEHNLDKLFDLSACKCKLEEVSCNH